MITQAQVKMRQKLYTDWIKIRTEEQMLENGLTLVDFRELCIIMTRMEADLTSITYNVHAVDWLRVRGFKVEEPDDYEIYEINLKNGVNE